jgi:hypothetical protein
MRTRALISIVMVTALALSASQIQAAQRANTIIDTVGPTIDGALDSGTTAEKGGKIGGAAAGATVITVGGIAALRRGLSSGTVARKGWPTVTPEAIKPPPDIAPDELPDTLPADAAPITSNLDNLTETQLRDIAEFYNTKYKSLLINIQTEGVTKEQLYAQLEDANTEIKKSAAEGPISQSTRTAAANNVLKGTPLEAKPSPPKVRFGNEPGIKEIPTRASSAYQAEQAAIDEGLDAAAESDETITPDSAAAQNLTATSTAEEGSLSVENAAQNVALRAARAAISDGVATAAGAGGDAAVAADLGDAINVADHG